MSMWRRSAQAIQGTSVVVTEPTIEPVSLSQVKLAIRENSSHDDPYLKGLIIAARRQVEKDLSDACLVSTVVDYWVDGTPSSGVLRIPRWPLQSVEWVKVYDYAGGETTLSSDSYTVDTVSRPGRVILNHDASWPSHLRSHRSIVVRHVSGFYPGTPLEVASLAATGVLTTTNLGIPELYTLAIMTLVAHWYDNRGPGAEGLPMSYTAMISDAPVVVA